MSWDRYLPEIDMNPRPRIPSGFPRRSRDTRPAPGGGVTPPPYQRATRKPDPSGTNVIPPEVTNQAPPASLLARHWKWTAARAGVIGLILGNAVGSAPDAGAGVASPASTVTISAPPSTITAPPTTVTPPTVTVTAPPETITVTEPAQPRTVMDAGTATDPRFDTCKEALAAGYGNYRQGEDPEYSWYQDRDGDGVVCE